MRTARAGSGTGIIIITPPTLIVFGTAGLRKVHTSRHLRECQHGHEAPLVVKVEDAPGGQSQISSKLHYHYKFELEFTLKP